MTPRTFARPLCYPRAMTTAEISGRPFGAVLCDLDNVIRFCDTTELAGLERGAGLAEGTTERVAFAPATDLPPLLGEITKEQGVGSIAAGLAGQVPEAGRASWRRRSPRRRSGPTTSWSPCSAGRVRTCPWCR
ncbi:hypothetical protein SUDANB176_03407 [Streptomyces sp. enrichment culture]